MVGARLGAVFSSTASTSNGVSGREASENPWNVLNFTSDQAGPAGLGWPGSGGNQSHHSVSSQVIHLEPLSKLVYNTTNNNIQLCNTVASDKADETRQRQHTRRTFLRFLFSLKKRDNTEFSEMYLMCNSPPSYPRLEKTRHKHIMLVNTSDA